MARCILCDGASWRDWFLCLPCIRYWLDCAKAGRAVKMPTRAETRKIIADARAYAATIGRR